MASCFLLNLLVFLTIIIPAAGKCQITKGTYPKPYYTVFRTTSFKLYSCIGELESIPNDIPNDVTNISITNTFIKTVPSSVFSKHRLCLLPWYLGCSYHLYQVNLSQNDIDTIEKFAFSGLKVEVLDLSENMIHSISDGMFPTKVHTLFLSKNNLHISKVISFNDQNVISTLDLSNNNIHSLSNAAFKHFGKLKTLILCNNLIKEISHNTWTGLKELKRLDLSYNKIHSLPVAMLNSQWQLNSFNLSHNNINSMGNKAFHLGSIGNLDLSNNLMISTYKGLLRNQGYRGLNLKHNKLSVICKKTFRNQVFLLHLDLSFNEITVIKKGAFVGLMSLNELILEGNKLKVLNQDFFYGIDNGTLKGKFSVNLKSNLINKVESGVFSFLENFYYEKPGLFDEHYNLDDKIPHIFIDLSKNKLLKLSWMIFYDHNKKYKCDDRILTKHIIQIDITDNILTCSREYCWLQQNDFEYDNNSFVSCGSKATIFSECQQRTAAKCPHIDNCMLENNTECSDKCRREEKPGRLSKDPYMCPFQYLCTCISCPVINLTKCEARCMQKGQIAVIRKSYDTLCDTCDCQCMDLPCKQVCRDKPSELINTTHGCLECKCLCSNVDCDSPCGGKGLGAIKNDTFGCLVCDGCTLAKNEDDVFLMIGVSLALAFVMGAALFLISFFLRLHAKPEEHSFDQHPKTENLLDTLVSNLEPDVANEVRQCWINPGELTAHHFLSKGNFGLIWSGRLVTGPFSEQQVAIKKVRAQYTDGWKHINKHNAKGELKPHFYRINIQMQMDNKAVEEFLQEAIIMRQFDHPNILSICGVSVHEDKLCIILPLMINGDLEKYLQKHKQALALTDLLSFALGAVKGMAHLEKQQVIHCDLAARNCMLDNNLLLKISDFGLARTNDQNNQNIDNDDATEFKKDRRGMPIRWMSIEATEHSIFSTKSDVWAYGVLLWEIFSFSKLPYYGLETNNILVYIKNGGRLPQPPLCPDFMYKIMLDCWNSNLEERPDFIELLSTLNKIADREAAYTEMTEQPSPQDNPEDGAKQKMITSTQLR